MGFSSESMGGETAQETRTRWWNDEVKEALKKKVVFLMWLRQNIAEAKAEYFRATKELQGAVSRSKQVEA